MLNINDWGKRSRCLKPTQESEITPPLSLHRRSAELPLYLTTASISNNCHVHRDPFALKHLYIGSSAKTIDCQNIGDRITSSLHPLENKLLISVYAMMSAFFILCGWISVSHNWNSKFTKFILLNHADYDVTISGRGRPVEGPFHFVTRKVFKSP